MDDKIRINLRIADFNYPLVIKREEEEMIREAAKQVNIKINAYRKHYPSANDTRALAMVAYQFALERLQWMQHNDTAPFAERVKQLEELLEEELKK